MLRKLTLIFSLLAVTLLSGCATVPMASNGEDQALKTFQKPAGNKAGLYLYRNSFGGQALKKNIYIDGKLIGETANKVYFHKLLTPGKYELATESEFSENNVTLEVEAGKNYFVEQYIKMGVFVGGAGIKVVDSEEGMKNVLQCKLAKETTANVYLKTKVAN